MSTPRSTPQSAARSAPRTPDADGFVTVPPGLAKVIVTDTELGDVRGEEGFFHYRQFSAVELAEQVGFEQACHLLVHGHLPDEAELAAFRRRLGGLRVLPPELAQLLPELCATPGDALQVLRTALSAWGGIAGVRPLYDCDEAEKLVAALTAVAVTPTVLAAAHRIRQGLEPIAADPSLGHAEDYLRMVTGRMPADRDARAVEQYLVATMDHGFNASTFTARESSPRPGPTSRPASSGRSAPSRVRSTAAPRAAPSRRSTRSARSTAPTPGCGPGSRPATG